MLCMNMLLFHQKYWSSKNRTLHWNISNALNYWLYYSTLYLHEHNVGSLHSNVSACTNSNPYISLSQGRRVIDPITHHCYLKRGECRIL